MSTQESTQETAQDHSVETPTAAIQSGTSATDTLTNSEPVAGHESDTEKGKAKEQAKESASTEKDDPIQRQDLFVPLSTEVTSTSTVSVVNVATAVAVNVAVAETTTTNETTIDESAASAASESAEVGKGTEDGSETKNAENGDQSAENGESAQEASNGSASQKQESKKAPLTKRQMVRVEGLGGMILEEELRSAFRPYGELGMIGFEDPFRDTAVIRFTKIADAAKATAELDGKVINDRVVRVSHPDADSVVFVGNLPLEYTEDKIRRWFAEFGCVERILLIRNKDGNSKGYAIVEYKTAEQAGVAKMNAHHRVIGDRNPHVEWFEWRTNSTFHSRTVFVDKLSRDFKDEVALKDYFQLQGPIIDCFIALSSYGNSRRTAYVEFEKEEDAEKAWLKLQDADFHGSKIRVSFCNPMKTVATLRVVLNQPGNSTKPDQHGRHSSSHHNQSRGGPAPSQNSRSYNHSRGNSVGYDRGGPMQRAPPQNYAPAPYPNRGPSHSYSNQSPIPLASQSRGGVNQAPYQRYPQERQAPPSSYGGYSRQQPPHNSYPQRQSEPPGSYSGYKRPVDSYYDEPVGYQQPIAPYPQSNAPLLSNPGFQQAPQQQYQSSYSYQSPSQSNYAPQPSYTPQQYASSNQGYGAPTNGGSSYGGYGSQYQQQAQQQHPPSQGYGYGQPFNDFNKRSRY